MNPFRYLKPHLIQFEDGTFGVRCFKGFPVLWKFLDISKQDFWWGNFSYTSYRYYRGTREAAEKALKLGFKKEQHKRDNGRAV